MAGCIVGLVVSGGAIGNAATLTVTNGNDSGAGTLRAAILSAATGDTITFLAGVSTINLTSNELSITRDVKIIGPGPGLLTVQRSSGGYFRVFDIASAAVTATISGMSITNGNAWNANGGGIYNAGALTVTNCSITGNTCNDFGCGLYNAGVMTLTNCTISNNIEAGGGGGGINNSGRLMLTGCTVSGNAAPGGGGIDNTGTLTVSNSTFSNNSANYYGGGAIGGALLNFNGTVILTNCTFSGNSANPFSPTSGQSSEGGAIYTNGGSLTLTSCTVTGNASTGSTTGSAGGGIFNSAGITGSAVTLRSCIVALNTSSMGTPDLSGAFTSQGWNLIGNSSTATITAAQTSDHIGTAGSPLDPRLGPLQNNGGRIPTCALLSGSPAIDAGDDSVLLSPLSLATDARGSGFPRKVGAHVDIGAFEFGAGVVAPAATTAAASGITFDSATLNGTVNASNNNSTTVAFDYGTSTAYGTQVAATPSTATGNIATPVNAMLTGLTPNTTYHYRVTAACSVATATGKDLTFTTRDQPPTTQGDSVLALPSAKVVIDVLSNDMGTGGAPLTVYSFTQPEAVEGTVARAGTKLIFTPSAAFTGGFFTYIAADAFGGRSLPTAVNLDPGTCLCASFLSAASDQATSMFAVNASAPFTVTGSPAWLSFNPIQPGDAQITFKFVPNPLASSRVAIVKVGGNPVTVTQLGVAAPPVLTVPTTIPKAAISANYDLAIPTQFGPVTYTTTGLPPGLALSNLTGHITGMPTTAGTYHATVSARNIKGSSNTLAFDVTVLPFPASLAGGWSALLARNAAVNAGLGGLLSFTVAANGPVTGTLKNGAASYAFTGRLNTATDPSSPDPEHPRLTVAIPHTSLVLVVNLNSPGTYLAGTLTQAADVATLSGAQQVWAIPGHAAATDYAGSFTAALQPTTADASIPQGDGFLTFSVSGTGVISWGGQLADGTILPTGSSALWPAGEVPLFVPLYTGKGSLLGSPVITATARVLSGSLDWSKLPQPATVRAYAAGFGALNPVGLSILGGGYTPPTSGLAVLTNVMPPTGSAQITFTDGSISGVNMASHLTQTLTISSASIATLPGITGGNPANVSISKIDPAKGTFTGSVALRDPNPFSTILPQVSRSVVFNGVFLQGGNNLGTGWFLLPSITGPPANVTTSPLTSGQVLITPAK